MTLAVDGVPDDGLAVNIVASGVTVRPVDDMPVVRDADLKARVTGRTATVNIGQGIADTPTGRKMTPRACGSEAERRSPSDTRAHACPLRTALRTRPLRSATSRRSGC